MSGFESVELLLRPIALMTCRSLGENDLPELRPLVTICEVEQLELDPPPLSRGSGKLGLGTECVGRQFIALVGEIVLFLLERTHPLELDGATLLLVERMVRRAELVGLSFADLVQVELELQVRFKLLVL